MPPKKGDSASPGLLFVPWEEGDPPSEQVAEAKLHQEGYTAYRWHDVAGVNYPIHRHLHDECIWVLKGEITFEVEGESFTLKAGDRLYLPSRTPHSAEVPMSTSATYLVGEKRND